MNPYVYSRSRKVFVPARSEQQATSVASSLVGMVKTAFTSAISPAVAFAMVLFAAGSVGGMSLVAYSEISNGSFAPLSHVASAHKPGSVLGAATYGYNQPVCNNGYCLNYEILGNNGTNWFVRVDYTVPRNYGGAWISSNGNILASNLSGTNSVYTDYTLSPNSSYVLNLYSSRYSSDARASVGFYTPSLQVANCSARVTPPSGCYYDNTSTCGGNLVCNTTEPVPSYGYVNPFDPSKGYVEGWLETSSSNNAIQGWAYDNGRDVNVTINLQDVNDSSKTYSVNTKPYYYREDVATHIASRFGTSKPSVSTAFSADLSIVTRPGVYKITTATFNGNKFGVIPSQVPDKIAIGLDHKLHLVSPNGGESWQIGGTQPITWTDVNAQNSSSQRYTIYLTYPNGGGGGVIADVTNVHEYIWNVGDLKGSSVKAVAGTPYIIQIVKQQVDGSGTFDQSDSYFKLISAPSSFTRTGKIINKNGTVYLVGDSGLYGFPNLAVFQSWGYSFSQIESANSAEQSLSQVGIVPAKKAGCSSPLDQIAGNCVSISQPAVISYGVNASLVSPVSVTAGAVSQKISSFAIIAGSNNSISLRSVSLYAVGNNISSFQNLKLTVNGNQVGSVVGSLSLGGVYTFTPSSSIVVPANGTIILDVYADAQSTVTSSSNGPLFNLSGLSYAVSDTIISTDNINIPGQSISVLSTTPGAGLSSITLSTNSPLSQFVIGGSSNQKIAVYNFSSASAVTINKLVFRVPASGGVRAISSVTVNGVTAPAVDGSAILNGVNLSLSSVNQDVAVTVSYLPVSIDGIPSNTQASVMLSSVGFTFNSSGVFQTLPFEVSSNVMRVVGSYPTLSLSSATTNLAVGLMQVGSITISANPGGNVVITSLPITVSASGATINTASPVVLTDASNGQAISTTGTFRSEGGDGLILAFSNGYTIAAGTSKTYYINIPITAITGSAPKLTLALGSAYNLVFNDTTGRVNAINSSTGTGSLIPNYPTNTVSIGGSGVVSSISPRVGSIINKNGTVYLVGSTGLYGFPNLAVFQSWGYAFSQIVTANSAEQALSQVGIVPTKSNVCSSPLDQIAGRCPGVPVVSAISVSLNNLLTSPVAVIPGAISQKVASFKISAGSIGDVSLTGVTIGATRNNIGSTYQNLKVMSGSTQLGVVQASVASNGSYTFTFNSPLVVPANSAVVLDVYVDVTTSADGSVINNQNLVSLNSVTGNLTSSGSGIGAVSAIAGQTILIPSSGPSLNLSLDSSSAPAGNVPAGANDFSVATFKLTSSGTGIYVSTFAVSTQTGNDCNSFINLKLFDATGLQLGSTFVAMSPVPAAVGYSCQATFSNMGLIIPNGSSQYLTLRVSVPNTATAANFKFTVINVVAASAVTGQTLPFSSSSYVSGNTMTISPIPTTVVTPRVGQIINRNGNIYLVGSAVLYPVQDIASFNSWGFTFSQVLTANIPELSMQISSTFLTSKKVGCTNPLDQLAGSCGVTVNPVPTVINYDVNSDGQVNVADFQKMVNAVLGSDATCSIKCDLNGDGLVNVADMQKMTNYFTANVNTQVSYTSPYDVNSDGQVNVADFQKVYNAVLGIDTTCSLKCDVDSDGQVNVADLQKVINYLIGAVAPVSNIPVISSAVIYGNVLSITGTFPTSGTNYVYVNGQGIVPTSQSASQVTASVSGITSSSVSVVVLNTSYGASSPFSATVVSGGGAGGGNGGGTPAASLTANGKSGTVTVSANDTINYQWSAPNAASGSSYYTINKVDSCGNSSTSTQYPWEATTAVGSSSKTVQSCQSGTTYTIVFSAPGFTSATLTIVVYQATATNNLALQGYDPAASSPFTTTVSSGKFLVIYGTFLGKSSSGTNLDTVTVNGTAQTIAYDSASQLNVQLGTLSGATANVVVNGNSTGSIGIK